MKRVLHALFSAMLTIALLPFSAFGATDVSSATPEQPRLDHIPGAAIVKFRSPVTTADVARTAGRLGGVSSEFRAIGKDRKLFSVRVPKGKTTETYIAQLESDPTVEYAEKEYIRQPVVAVPPNDPIYSDSATWVQGSVHYPWAKSWWLRDSGASAFWSNYNNSSEAGSFPSRAGNSQFKVAVIDTGFYMNHPDRGANIVAGKDEFQSYSSTTGVLTKDDDVTPVAYDAPLNDLETAAHGTCVAGQVASATDNGVGVASVGYDNQVRVYKVQGIWIEGYAAFGYPPGSAVILDTPVIDAIRRAADDGCKIINLSLGGYVSSQALQDAVNYAHNKGAVVVAATGNDGESTNFYPAACDNVVGVGSYELDAAGGRVRSGFSNYGSQLDVLAPGAMIHGLTNPDYDADGPGTDYAAGYDWWAGTSMASPAFAGLLAMAWRYAPALTNAEISDYLLTNATAQGSQPNTDHGYGYVNIAAAYDDLKRDYPYLTKPAVTTSKSLYNTSDVTVAWSAATGRGIGYKVALDGHSPQTTSSTSATFSALSEGEHTVTVQPTSAYNWYTEDTHVAFTFRVDLTSPTVTDLAYVDGAFTWTDSEGDQDHVTEVRLDEGGWQLIEGNSYAMGEGSLDPGTHTFSVRITDEAGNVGAIASLGFEYPTPLGPPPEPHQPVIEAMATVTEPTSPVRWHPAQHATSYEYRLNGGAILVTNETSATVSGLAKGTNTLEVRSRNSTGASAWAVAELVFVPPVPAAPAPVPAHKSVVGSSVAVEWKSVAHAAAYEYQLNGVMRPRVTSRSAVISGLAVGDNAIRVRAVNVYGDVGPWSGPITVRRMAVYSVSLISLSPVIVISGSSSSLSAKVSSSGAPVRGVNVDFEYSYDRVTWKRLGSAASGADGRASHPYKASRTTWLRAVVPATGTNTRVASASSKLSVTPRLGRAKVPTTVRKNQRFTIHGFLSPKHTKGAKNVRIKLYRLKGDSWRYEKTIKATNGSHTAGTTKYVAKTKLPYRGIWKAVAYYPATSNYAAATATRTKFRVK